MPNLCPEFTKQECAKTDHEDSRTLGLVGLVGLYDPDGRRPEGTNSDFSPMGEFCENRKNRPKT
jgi:hypothetical protein